MKTMMNMNLNIIFTQNSVKMMKASVERMIHILAGAKVPFAHQIVCVAHCGKLVCHGGKPWVQTPRIARQEGNTNTNICRISASHQGCSGGWASWMDIVVVKSEYCNSRMIMIIVYLPDCISCKFVNILSDKWGVRVGEAYISISLVICQAEKW